MNKCSALHSTYCTSLCHISHAAFVPTYRCPHSRRRRRAPPGQKDGYYRPAADGGRLPQPGRPRSGMPSSSCNVPIPSNKNEFPQKTVNERPNTEFWVPKHLQYGLLSISLHCYHGAKRNLDPTACCDHYTAGDYQHRQLHWPRPSSRHGQRACCGHTAGRLDRRCHSHRCAVPHSTTPCALRPQPSHNMISRSLTAVDLELMHRQHTMT